MACAPLAPPLRSGGVAVIIARLFGDWKNPKPMPQSAVRQAMSRLEASLPSRASPIRPPDRQIRPAPARMDAGYRSERRPDTSAIAATISGQGVISSPVSWRLRASWYSR
ncbi:hypothetical protein D3C81_1309440 [compost metagenome]